jgi:polyferredoxin
MRWYRPLPVSRKVVQILVLLVIVVTPIFSRYAYYLNARQLDKVMERFDGSIQGDLLVLTDKTIRAVAAPDIIGDDYVRRNRKEAMRAAAAIKGTVWSFELFGISLTDPLALLESAVSSKSLPWVLVLGTLIPILLTVMLGRVFCAWLCPVGFLLELSGKLRGLLRYLEIKPGKARLWYGNKYLILVLGLALAATMGLPFLGYLYPPALLSREIHSGVTVMYDRAELGSLGFTAAGLTIASWFLLTIAVVEIAFGSRMWCRSLCPGGAVYSVLSRFRIIRVKRVPEKCTHCAECVLACDMGLNPMTDITGTECDNCGACVTSCPDDALDFAFSMKDTIAETEVGTEHALTGSVLAGQEEPEA